MTAVLLAEDDDDLREVASLMLAMEGCEVTLAVDGSTACRVLEGSLAFDALVLDMSMPGFTGLEVARAARGAGYAGPVLLWTGWDLVLEGSALDELDVVLLPKHDVMRMRSEVVRRARSFRHGDVVPSPQPVQAFPAD